MPKKINLFPNPSLHYPKKTLKLIDDMIQEDQGARYREWLGKVIPHIGDAYDPDSFPFRSHMGASQIGGPCLRAVWYGFRWCTRPEFEGRMIRLFNRGHMEEARFIAMLLMIGVQVYQQDANGNQFRITHADGYFGGSGDGVGVNIPDLPDPNMTCLLEFKTCADKKFNKLVKDGVRIVNPHYYVQVQIYMKKMGIPVTLHLTVNKDNDQIYGELIYAHTEIADLYLQKGQDAVETNTPPPRIHNNPSHFDCMYCDHIKVCHQGEYPYLTCRTCDNVEMIGGGKWKCTLDDRELDKHDQLGGCDRWSIIPEMLIAKG
jgi:hypothetical protein